MRNGPAIAPVTRARSRSLGGYILEGSRRGAIEPLASPGPAALAGERVGEWVSE